MAKAQIVIGEMTGGGGALTFDSIEKISSFTWNGNETKTFATTQKARAVMFVFNSAGYINSLLYSADDSSHAVRCSDDASLTTIMNVSSTFTDNSITVNRTGPTQWTGVTGVIIY